MPAPTLTFTPAMFYLARKDVKHTTRRLIALPRTHRYVRARRVGHYTHFEADEPDKVMFTVNTLKAPHVAGEIKPMVTTWAVHSDWDDIKPSDIEPDIVSGGIWFDDGSKKPEWAGKSRPGRFLPKTLYDLAPKVEILTVQAEFLRDITEESALDEGITKITKDSQVVPSPTWKYGLADRDGWPGTDDHGWPWSEWEYTARDAYFKLWDSINATRDAGRFTAIRNPAC